MTSAHLANLLPFFPSQQSLKALEALESLESQHEASLRGMIPCTKSRILSGGMAYPPRPEAAGTPRRLSAARNEATEAALGSGM